MNRIIIVVSLLSVVLPARAGDMDLRLRGRLQTRFEVEERHQDGSLVSRVRLRRARVDGCWMPVKWIRLVLELEGAARLDLQDANGAQSSQAMLELKDAYGRFDLGREFLRVQVGQFKKPFSRLKMESPWDLLLPVRGLLNRYAVNHTQYSGYGGRDVGLMFSGRLKHLARFSWKAGIFSGPRYVDRMENSSTDYLARFQLRPFKGMRVALNMSHKVYHYKEGATQPGVVLTRGATYTGNLFGADIRFRFNDLTLLVEGALGDNLDFGPGHTLFGIHGTLAYSLEVYRNLWLIPAIMVEWFDPSDQDGYDSALRVAVALNIDIEQIIRLVVFIEGASGEIVYWDPDAGGYVTEKPPIRTFVQLNMSF